MYLCLEYRVKNGVNVIKFDAQDFNIVSWVFRKANTVLRAKVKSQVVYVIPNAVDSCKFKPLQPNEKAVVNNSRSKKYSLTFEIWSMGEEINFSYSQIIAVVIVMLSRLVYRKGVDLMTEIIPILCDRHEDVSQTQNCCLR